MAQSKNSVTLIGNVGKDPDVKVASNGNKIANMTIATTEKWTDKSGEKKEITDWHNVVIYGGLADIVEKYVKKGSKICVDGKLKTRKYTDKDGKDRYVTEVIIDQKGEILLLGGNDKHETKAKEEHKEEQEMPEDSVPF